MRRAFSKPTSGDAELADLLQGYRRAGFEGLQLKAGQYAPHLSDPDGFRTRWGDDPGAVSALIVFDDLDEAGRERLDRTLDFAAAVGAERVVFCQNRSRAGATAEDRRELARTLSAHAHRAADTAGVRLSLHHHHDQPVMTPQDAREFFDAVEPGAVGLTVDTAHLAKSGVEDLPGFVAEFAAVIDNIHLKDYADGQWRLLGEGELDLAGAVGQLRRQGYDGWLCADEESSASLAQGLTASQRWLDTHL